MKKVLIASPIKQKSNILFEFLNSLEKLNNDGLDFYYYFVDDNSEKESSDLLKKFKKNNKRVLLKSFSDFNVENSEEYICDKSTHQWKSSLIKRITLFKDDMIRMAKDDNFDYLFFVDSDIVLNPNTIIHLISRNVDIVSNVFWTIWKDGGMLLPQVWLQDESSSYIRDWDYDYSDEEKRQKTRDFINMLKVPGIYRVGGLGACTLISKKAIHAGISFALVDNVSFWGEDRHFCIRARALGLDLYVDTVYPAYHIYREEYLAGVDEFKKNGFNPNLFKTTPLNKKKIINLLKNKKVNNGGSLEKIKSYLKKIKRVMFIKKRIVNDKHSITVSMIVHNEEDRYLKRVLEAAKKYADNFVIIDDASTDNTVELCEKILKDVNHKIVKNEKSLFSEEYKLRTLQWRETISENPDWIMFLDADEEFENDFNDKYKYLIANNDVDAYCFRLYDMWDEKHYRKDKLWNPDIYRPFLIRYQPKYRYKFRKINHHCGRLPANALHLNYANSIFRVKHYGWMNLNDRKEKYNRYKKMDPDAIYGNKEQYESILDKNPNLIEFEVKDEN